MAVPAGRPMKSARALRPCFCSICPECHTDKHVVWTFIGRGPVRSLGRSQHHCRTCGTRWQAWHWLEERTGLTWRRFEVVNPGAFTPAQAAELTVLRTLYRRGEVTV